VRIGGRHLQTRLAAGVIAALIGMVWLILSPPDGLRLAQERGFDQLIRWATPDPYDRSAVGYVAGAAAVPLTPPVIVVDLAAQDETGAQWNRAATARLVQRLAGAGPAVIVFDIVFSGNCAQDPANAALTAGLAEGPVALGFLLSEFPLPVDGPPPRLAVAGSAAGLFWQVPGAEMACPLFGAASAGAGSLALFSDSDGLVRRVPAAVGIGGAVYPALAVEAVRLALDDPSPIIGTGPGAIAAPWLRLGGRQIWLDPGAEIRLVPSGPAVWAARTWQAVQVLDPQTDLGPLAGAVVLVGSSLPERGGLRTTAASAVHPSVQIEADLVTSLLSGTVPFRQAAASKREAMVAAAGGIAVLILILSLPTLPAITGAAGLALLWALIVALVYRGSGLLLDPLGPMLVTAITALLALVGQATLTGRAERALRRKMGQLLPPAVVSRLIAEPALFRLEGESRVITAVFTDIEGFSATTRSLGPRELVRVLDAYFTLTCSIVLRHGGMVDKMVGDSVHAYFNAPLDQPQHTDAAIACATEIIAQTEALRRDPAFAAACLGRTRIGIETGPVVLGDVGSGVKIDYTAHGDAVNLAARLQEANKELGTAICIGPAAAAVTTVALRPVGLVDIRSFGQLSLHIPA